MAIAANKHGTVSISKKGIKVTPKRKPAAKKATKRKTAKKSR
jgi:hypothetical protein